MNFTNVGFENSSELLQGSKPVIVKHSSSQTAGTNLVQTVLHNDASLRMLTSLTISGTKKILLLRLITS